MRRALGRGDGLCLLLGVTPELADLSTQLVAIDNSAAMIQALWLPGRARRSVVQGDWLAMPFADQMFDAIIGDGSLVLLSCPMQYEQLFQHLRRVVRPNGKIVIRVFVSPEQTETCADVFAAVRSGRIGSFHAFKWRLAMAMAAESADRHVHVAEVYAVFSRLFLDRTTLAKATGWSLADMATIDAYQDSLARYSYPTLLQVRQIFSRWFRELGVEHGSYELAERCPILILEPNGR
jgi:ubiquinone/menaquinone biosynthesis C-methylase UbiE